MPFVKGQSGNPLGSTNRNRAEDRKVKRLARQHTEAAIRRLAALMDSDSPSASVAACSAILDRAYGKPKQTVDASVTRYLVSVTEADELRAKLESSLVRRTEPTEHTVQ